jgi:hypothetical protein
MKNGLAGGGGDTLGGLTALCRACQEPRFLCCEVSSLGSLCLPIIACPSAFRPTMTRNYYVARAFEVGGGFEV